MNITDVGHLAPTPTRARTRWRRPRRHRARADIAAEYTRVSGRPAPLDSIPTSGARPPTTSPSRSRLSTRSRPGVSLQHRRRRLLRHRDPPRLRLPRAPRPRRARGDGRVEPARSAPRRLRAVEIELARRAAPDGMGLAVGPRLPRLAHRVLGDGAEVPRRLFRHPLRRRGPHPRPSHQRDRTDRGALHLHPWVPYWVHHEFLRLGADKMSKVVGSTRCV